MQENYSIEGNRDYQYTDERGEVFYLSSVFAEIDKIAEKRKKQINEIEAKKKSLFEKMKKRKTE